MSPIPYNSDRLATSFKIIVCPRFIYKYTKKHPFPHKIMPPMKRTHSITTEYLNHGRGEFESQPWTAGTFHGLVWGWIVLFTLAYGYLERKSVRYPSIVHAFVSPLLGTLLLSGSIDAPEFWFGHSMGYYVANTFLSKKPFKLYSALHHAATIAVYFCIGMKGLISVYGIQTQTFLSIGNIALHAQNFGYVQMPRKCGLVYLLSRIAWLAYTVIPLTLHSEATPLERIICGLFWCILFTNFKYWSLYRRKYLKSWQ